MAVKTSVFSSLQKHRRRWGRVSRRGRDRGGGQQSSGEEGAKNTDVGGGGVTRPRWKESQQFLKPLAGLYCAKKKKNKKKHLRVSSECHTLGKDQRPVRPRALRCIVRTGLVFSTCARARLPFTLTCVMASRGYIIFALKGDSWTPAASGTPVDYGWRRWGHGLPSERCGSVWLQETLPFITSCCQAAVTSTGGPVGRFRRSFWKTPCHLAALFLFFSFLMYQKPVTSLQILFLYVSPSAALPLACIDRNKGLVQGRPVPWYPPTASLNHPL